MKKKFYTRDKTLLHHANFNSTQHEAQFNRSMDILYSPTKKVEPPLAQNGAIIDNVFFMGRPKLTEPTPKPGERYSTADLGRIPTKDRVFRQKGQNKTAFLINTRQPQIQKMINGSISTKRYGKLLKISSDPSRLDCTMIKERLMRNFLFKKNFNPGVFSKTNMSLYKHVFGIEESFLELIGPEDQGFDKRFMTKPVSTQQERPVDKRKMNQDSFESTEKQYLRSLFRRFHTDQIKTGSGDPEEDSEHRKRLLKVLEEYCKTYWPNQSLSKVLLPPVNVTREEIEWMKAVNRMLSKKSPNRS